MRFAFVRDGGGGGGVSLVSIEITPSPAGATVGATVQMTATGTYSDASERNLTSAVAWSSSDESILTMSTGSGGGLLAGIAEGTATVTATLDGVTATLSVDVIQTATLASFSLPIPNTTNVGLGADLLVAFPFWVPPDASAVTIKMSNRYLAGSGGGVGNSLTTDVAIYASNGSGAPTGSPIVKWLAQVIPGDGSELTVGTFTPTRGGDGKVVIVYGIPDATTRADATAQNYGLFATGTLTVDPLPGGWSGACPYGFLWVSPSFQTTRRKIYVLGDSISIGVSGPGYDGSAWVQIGPHKDVIMCMSGCGGSTLAHRAQSSTFSELWTDIEIDGNDFYIEAMVNSLTSGLASMQADFTTLVGYLRSNGANLIYSQTCAPMGGFFPGPTVETTRTDWNTWMLANSLGLDGIVDIDLTMRDPSAHANLLAAYDCGDLIHWSVAGHAAAKTAIEAVVTP